MGELGKILNQEDILYHNLKHQFSDGIAWIQENRNQWYPFLKQELMSLGGSQLDYYLGNLEVENIKMQICEYVNRLGIRNKTTYRRWISDNYQEITLSDSSQWTLRFLDLKQYVHIHPSRHSLHTIRVKAKILKSVMCTLLFENTSMMNIDKINTYRTKYLELSPISSEKNHSQLNEIYNLFQRYLRFKK